MAEALNKLVDLYLGEHSQSKDVSEYEDFFLKACAQALSELNAIWKKGHEDVITGTEALLQACIYKQLCSEMQMKGQDRHRVMVDCFVEHFQALAELRMRRVDVAVRDPPIVDLFTKTSSHPPCQLTAELNLWNPNTKTPAKLLQLQGDLMRLTSLRFAKFGANFGSRQCYFVLCGQSADLKKVKVPGVPEDKKNKARTEVIEKHEKILIPVAECFNLERLREAHIKRTKGMNGALDLLTTVQLELVYNNLEADVGLKVWRVELPSPHTSMGFAILGKK